MENGRQTSSAPVYVVAVIPARGGSKGIPRKNLLRINGVPLVSRTILAALSAKRVTRVVVSTDDPEIASVSKQSGAEVILRPPELASDIASSESVLLHALEAMHEADGARPDLLVFLQCTSPLTSGDDIDGAIELVLDQRADTAVAVAATHQHLWRDTPNGGLGINHDPRERLRRQDREVEYTETGAIYVMRVDGFLEAKHRFFGRTALYVMPRERSWEIDEPIDVAIASVLASVTSA